jgi:hypothetical protein
VSTGEKRRPKPSELRAQEVEFYESLMKVMAAMPPRSTIDDALASDAGRRVRSKWMLKYGREAPL